ncbi:MAG: glycosyltransferase family 2 protein [Clostridiales bacterium]|nr:glycosyltransferase family 2 protein [Clostridiales bacterium]
MGCFACCFNNKKDKYEGLYNKMISSCVKRIKKIFYKIWNKAEKVKIIRYLGKAVYIFFKQGPKSFYLSAKRKCHLNKPDCSFFINEKRRKAETEHKFDKNPKISVVVPLYNTPIKYLNEMIASVEDQTYKNWELCLADGSDSAHQDVEETVLKLQKKDNRIIYKKLDKNLGISKNTNACIEIATGEYISLFDHDDLLHPSALFNVVKAINEENGDFIYTDEVTFLDDNLNNLVNYHFKSDFAPDTLRSYNYICHLTTFKKSLLEKTGLFREECDGSQDYDLILRLTEQAENIVHIPEILYFWRGHKNSTAQDINSKPYIMAAAHKALEDHLERIGIKGKVEDSRYCSAYRIKYDIVGEPLVSILIANKDQKKTLEVCINSIYEKTTYKNFEIIIIENNSTKQETFDYYEELKAKYENLKVVCWEDKFNYSAINNFGFKFAKGEFALLLNNDVEVISPDWIQEMLMFAQRSDVGAVGAMLYYPDDTIQHAGVIVGLGGVAGHAHKNLKRGELGYMVRASIQQNFSAVTFACVMIPSKVFNEVNGLDEKFQVAFNDVDMCMRIREKGYLIVFTPYAELYHHESKSRGTEDTPEKVKRFNSEINRFKERWKAQLEKGDPYYNPHLTLNYEDFSFKNE